MAIVTTDCRPLTNAERLALWLYKSALTGNIRWYRAWQGPLKLNPETQTEKETKK